MTHCYAISHKKSHMFEQLPPTPKTFHEKLYVESVPLSVTKKFIEINKKLGWRIAEKYIKNLPYSSTAATLAFYRHEIPVEQEDARRKLSYVLRKEYVVSILDK